MCVSEKHLNKELFLQSNFYDIIEDTDITYGYSSISSTLEQNAKKIAEDAPTLASAFTTISVLYSYVLVPESNAEPYKSLWKIEGKRSLIPEDLNDIQLAFLDEIKDEVKEPYLRSRIADVLWTLRFPKKDIENVRRAIDTFIEFELTPENIHKVYKELWLRAIHLSRSVRDQNRQDTIREKLLVYLRSAEISDSWFAHDLSEIMLTSYYTKDEQKEIVGILEKFISGAKENKDWHRVQLYVDTAILWYKRLDQEEDECRLKVENAESYYAQAEEQTNSNMGKGSLYEQALHCYRKVPRAFREQFDVENRLNLIHHKMKEANILSLREMSVISSGDIDISKYIEVAQKHVTHIPYPLVLLYLSGITGFRGREYYENQAKESFNETFLHKIFGTTTLSEDGRVSNRTPGIDLNENSDNQKAMWDQMMSDYQHYIMIAVSGSIIPALDVTNIEHTITFNMLLGVCSHSPIIDEGREYLWAKGLYFGFEKDWVSAIHLLTPQVEHYVRCILQESDIKTSTIEPSGLEKENGLSTLLDLPESVEILGTDFHFELQAMLTGAGGFNMRNELAHGLMNFGKCHSYVAIYFWWFCLKLVARALPWSSQD